jgi:hypothetical protein
MVVQEGTLSHLSVNGAMWEMAGSSWGETVINPYSFYFSALKKLTWLGVNQTLDKIIRSEFIGS